MSVKIANATERDAAKLISLPHRYHTKEEATWFVKSYFDYHHIKVVRLGSEIIGALFWRVEADKHHGIIVVDDFWISEKFRRQGLGEKLLRTSINDAKIFLEKDNYTLRKVLLTTAQDNKPARKLYEKIGFRKSAVLKDLFGKGENELVYILTLKP